MTHTTAAASEIAITVNGENRRVGTGTTIGELLRLYDLDARTVVVEHNREIVRDRDRLDSLELRPGDLLEIVHFVGGG